MDSNLLFAFGLTVLAGLSTGIGSLIAFMTKKTNKKFLSLGLGFSAGVMIYVAMIEIFFKAQESLVGELGETMGCWITVISFFAGMFLISLIDKVIPSPDSSKEIEKYLEGEKSEEKDQKKLLRMGT
ncbi:MAG: zinc transporter ZupT, partial [Spirochaetota bacterium]